MFTALFSLPFIIFTLVLHFIVFFVIPEGFHGVFVHQLNGTFIINVNHYRKCCNHTTVQTVP